MESQNLANLQILEVTHKYLILSGLFIIGFKKTSRENRSDTKKKNGFPFLRIEYRKNGNHWKKINLYIYDEKSL